MIEFTINAPHPVRCALIDPSTSDIDALAGWFGAVKDCVLGLDSETNAEDPWSRDYRLRLVQISDGQNCWLTPPHPAVAKLMHAHPRFVGHFTAKAEVPFIGRGMPGALRLGELDPHVVDYQTLQAIEDPRTLLPRKDGVDIRLIHDKGLKATYERKVSPCLREADERLHQWFHDNAPKGHRTAQKAATWGFANVPLDAPEYLEYSAMDAVAVKVLYDMDEKTLRESGQWPHVEYEQLLQWDIDNMVFRGNPVDPPYVRWLARQLDDVVDAERPYLAMHGVPPSAMGGSVGRAFEALGQEPVKWNKGRDGKPDTPCWDKDALAEVADLDTSMEITNLTQSILTVRRAGKFRSAYLKPMMESLDRDCRVHPQFRSIGTVTHRNSASDPPVQQMPKKDTRVRAAFGGVPGWVWVTCDLEQGEPRTMAGLSGDPAFCAAVLSGDVNNAIASDINGPAFIPEQGKTPGTPSYLMRQLAKIGLLSVCYAVGMRKLASSFRISVARASQFRDDVHRKYKVMFGRAAQLNRMEAVTLPSGRKIILWDRKLVLPDGRVITGSDPSRKGLNYETQGAQADWVKAAWLKLRPTWAWALAIFMHDEIGLFVPEAFAEQACRDLKAAMSGHIGHGVMMEASPSIEGRTWAPQPDTFDRTELESIEL